MRFAKRFPGDVSSSIVPKDMSKYARVATVVSVDSQAGLVNIQWNDKPLFQRDVTVLETSKGDTSNLEKGDVVLVIADQYSRSYVIGVINLGHEDRVKNLKTFPKFKPGEKFFEAGGSYVYMKKDGTVVISTLTGGIQEFNNVTQTWKLETVNWKIITNAGHNYFGEVKRQVTQLDGTVSLQPITNLIGEALTEHVLEVYATHDMTGGINPTVKPVAKITLGNVVDKQGLLPTANGVKALNSRKEQVVRMELASGVEISVDRDGIMTIKNFRANINGASVSPSNVDEVHQTNPVLGTASQGVARRHDEVTTPVGIYIDPQHIKLTEAATENSAFLLALAQKIVADALAFDPSAALTAAFLLSSGALKGIITKASEDVLVGDLSIADLALLPKDLKNPTG